MDAQGAVGFKLPICKGFWVICCGQRLPPTVMADDVEFLVISEEEKRKLADNSKIVSEFKQKKLEEEAQKNWDLFYKRNTTNFFKDRHWTTAEFKELLCENSNNEVSIRQTVYIG